MREAKIYNVIFSSHQKREISSHQLFLSRHFRRKDMEHTVTTVTKTAIRQLIASDKTKLFLNPVTDAMAPGYSTVIARPISLSDMKKMRWQSLADFSNDVDRMFSNCEEYNVGEGGKWFREESRRQRVKAKKIIKDCKDNLERGVKARGEDELRKKKASSSAAANDNKKNGNSLFATIPKVPPRSVPAPADQPNSILLASIIVSNPTITNRLLLSIYSILKTKIIEPSMKHATTGKRPNPVLPFECDDGGELIQLIQLLVYAYDSRPMSGGGGRTYWCRAGKEELGFRGEIAGE